MLRKGNAGGQPKHMVSELSNEVQIYSVIQWEDHRTDYFFHSPKFNDVAAQLWKESMKEGRIMASLGHYSQPLQFHFRLRVTYNGSFQDSHLPPDFTSLFQATSWR